MPTLAKCQICRLPAGVIRHGDSYHVTCMFCAARGPLQGSQTKAIALWDAMQFGIKAFDSATEVNAGHFLEDATACSCGMLPTCHYISSGLWEVVCQCGKRVDSLNRVVAIRAWNALGNASD